MYLAGIKKEVMVCPVLRGLYSLERGLLLAFTDETVGIVRQFLFN